MRKNAQEGKLIGTPQVEIDPGIKTKIQKAVDLLKSKNNNYFTNVEKIVGYSGANYGKVEHGPNKDPHVINLNMSNIEQSVKKHFNNTIPTDPQDKERYDEALLMAIVDTLSHELGHVQDYALSGTPENPFPHGESIAEHESDKAMRALFPNSSTKPSAINRFAQSNNFQQTDIGTPNQKQGPTEGAEGGDSREGHTRNYIDNLEPKEDCVSQDTKDVFDKIKKRRANRSITLSNINNSFSKKGNAFSGPISTGNPGDGKAKGTGADTPREEILKHKKKELDEKK